MTVLQLTRRCHAFSCPKIDYWSEIPTLFSNMAPNVLWLFLEVKSALKRQDSRMLRTPPKKVTTALKGIPKQEFQKCFQEWRHRWAKFIAPQREHFEGNPSQ
jgi:hypothetical protein